MNRIIATLILMMSCACAGKTETVPPYLDLRGSFDPKLAPQAQETVNAYAHSKGFFVVNQDPKSMSLLSHDKPAFSSFIFVNEESFKRSTGNAVAHISTVGVPDLLRVMIYLQPEFDEARAESLAADISRLMLDQLNVELTQVSSD